MGIFASFSETAGLRSSPLRRGYVISILFTLGSLLVAMFVVHFTLQSLYTTPLIQNPSENQQFNASRAFDDLRAITTEKHSVDNPVTIERVRQYIVDSVRNATSGSALPVEIDLDERDYVYNGVVKLVKGNVGPNDLTLLQSTNILVRMKGTGSGANETASASAFMVTAHYDSVSLSYGASDAGSGVVVMLEAMRQFAKHPTKHDLIFNFDCGEEDGLLGAKAFIGHKWFSDVRAYLNLEGGGVGGIAMVFRGRGMELYKTFAERQAFPTAITSLGNDMMKFIPSGTDFSVYDGSGIPGIEAAFFQRRAWYHTRSDNLENTGAHALANMGASAMAIMRGSADSNWLPTVPRSPTVDILGTPGKISQGPSILAKKDDPWRKDVLNYDILGKWTVIQSRGNFITVVIVLAVVAIVLIPFLAGGFAYLRSRSTPGALPFWAGIVAPLWRMALALILAAIAGLVLAAGFGMAIVSVNRYVMHANPIFFLVALQFAALAAIPAVMEGPFALLEIRRTVPRLADPAVRRRWMWYALPLAWAVLTLILGIATAMLGFGLFYRLPWFLGTSIVAAILTAITDPGLPSSEEQQPLQMPVPEVPELDADTKKETGSRAASLDDQSSELRRRRSHLENQAVVDSNLTVPSSPLARAPQTKAMRALHILLVLARFVFTTLFPLAFNFHTLFYISEALHHAIQEGTQAYMIVLLGTLDIAWAALIVLPYMSVIPIHSFVGFLTARNDTTHQVMAVSSDVDGGVQVEDAKLGQKKAQRMSLLMVLLWFILSLLFMFIGFGLSPFNNKDSPMKIFYGQSASVKYSPSSAQPSEYPKVTVSLAAADFKKLESVVNNIASVKKNGAVCTPAPSSTKQARCTYPLDQDVVNGATDRASTNVRIINHSVTKVTSPANIPDLQPQLQEYINAHYSNANVYRATIEGTTTADGSRHCTLSIADSYFLSPNTTQPPAPTEVYVQRAYFLSNATSNPMSELLPPAGDLAYTAPMIQRRQSKGDSPFSLEYMILSSKGPAQGQTEKQWIESEANARIKFTMMCNFAGSIAPVGLATEELEKSLPDWTILTGTRPFYAYSVDFDI
ncbi:hypothetical protein GQ42DRAFT_140036 [Ramicandelaber brevisporus]|nr:hypothetical protein GQ42DRAFT_140036 [Ramicandelaber brevisporus]